MPKKSAPTARQALPKYLELRGDRPRFKPSAKLQKLGWDPKPVSLYGPDGRTYVDLPEAIRQMQAINAAIDRVLAHGGEGKAPPELAAFFPKWALPNNDGARRPRKASGDIRRSIGFLFDKYFAMMAGDEAEARRLSKVAGEPVVAGTPRLAEQSIKDYRSKIGVTLKTIAELRGKELESIRAMDITFLRIPDEGSGLHYELLDAYEHMERTRGIGMAKGAIACTSAWFRWIKFKERLWVGENPCKGFECTSPEGRIETWEDDEIDAIAAAADWAGLPSLADALILALDSTWSQQDLLALEWTKVIEDDASALLTGRRMKTGIEMQSPLRARGRQRLAEIRARQAAWPQPPANVICSEIGQAPWNKTKFRHAFAAIRDIASAAAPYGLGNNGIREKKFLDSRDTGISDLQAMGLTDKQLATISGHSFGSVGRTTARAYSERERIGRGARRKIEDHIAAEDRRYGGR